MSQLILLLLGCDRSYTEPADRADSDTDLPDSGVVPADTDPVEDVLSAVQLTLDGCGEVSFGGDTELIEARLPNGLEPKGLIVHTTPSPQAVVCPETGETTEQVWVSVLDGNGLPEGTPYGVAGDECGVPGASDAEWSIGPSGAPLLAYTGLDGVRIVRFDGSDWATDVSHTAVSLQGSQTWEVAGEPLSFELWPIQFIVVDDIDWTQEPPTGDVIWGETTLANGNATVRHVFTDGTSPKTSLHPTRTDRLLRVQALDGFRRLTDWAPDDEVLMLRPLDGVRQVVRPFLLPRGEARILGFGNSRRPAVATTVQNQGNTFVVVVAQDTRGDWREAFRLPVPTDYRVDVTVVDHLEPARTVLLGTTDGDARLWTLDGSSKKLGPAALAGSEIEYLSTSGNLVAFLVRPDVGRVICSVGVDVF